MKNILAVSENQKNFLHLLVLALLSYVLFFSTRLAVSKYSIVGTDVVNDFTKVFIFAIDILALAGVGILALVNRPDVENSPNRKPLYLFIAFVAWAALSTHLASASTWLSSVWIVRLLIGAILFYFITHSPSRLTRQVIFWGITSSAFIQSLFALQQFIAQKSLGLGLLGESPLVIGQSNVTTFSAFGQKVLRAYGTLPHPNILAYFLSLSFIISIHLFLKTRDKVQRRILAGAGAVIGLGLLLTFSRIFILTTVIIVTFQYFYSYKRSLDKIKLAIIGVLVFIAIGTVAIRPFSQDNSYDLRSLHNSVARQIISENKFSGVGIGQSVLVSNSALRSEVANESYQKWMHQPAHNAFLLLGAETGLVGVVIFLAILLTIGRSILAKVRENYKKTPVLYGSLFAVVFMSLVFEHMIFTNPNSFYLTIVVLGLIFRDAKKLAPMTD